MSSVSVFGIGHDVVTVDTPLSDAHSSYTRSKVRAERAVRELQDGGAPIAIVYPSGVLGPDPPDVSVNHRALAAWLRTPPRTTSGTSIIDVRDVAIAIERVLDRPGRWMLGGEFLEWAELLSALQRVTGHQIRAVSMPPRTLRVAGRLGDAIKRVIPFDYPLTYEAMSMATRSCPYDSRATRRALDLHWRPVEDTLAESVGWLASAGHVTAKLAGTPSP